MSLLSRPVPLRDEVRRILREKVLEGELAPGDDINGFELAVTDQTDDLERVLADHASIAAALRHHDLQNAARLALEHWRHGTSLLHRWMKEAQA